MHVTKHAPDVQQMEEALELMRVMFEKPELSLNKKKRAFEKRVQKNENLFAFAVDLKLCSKDAYPTTRTRFESKYN